MPAGVVQLVEVGHVPERRAGPRPGCPASASRAARARRYRPGPTARRPPRPRRWSSPSPPGAQPAGGTARSCRCPIRRVIRKDCGGVRSRHCSPASTAADSSGCSTTTPTARPVSRILPTDCRKVTSTRVLRHSQNASRSRPACGVIKASSRAPTSSASSSAAPSSASRNCGFSPLAKRAVDEVADDLRHERIACPPFPRLRDHRADGGAIGCAHRESAG